MCSTGGRVPDRLPRAVDPRPARTRECIVAAIERLGARDADLTVAAVVAEARIARSSFYAQYRDLGDVAVQLLRELHADIEQLDAEIRRRGTGREAAAAATSLLITEFERRKVLYRAVLGTRVSYGTQHEIHRIMADAILPSVRQVAPPEIDPDFAASYVAAGVLTTLYTWLVATHPMPPAQLQAQIAALLPTWLVSEHPGPPSVHHPPSKEPST